MFIRRHPYLFFVLVFTGIVSVTSVLVSLISGVSERAERKFGERVGVIELKGVILDAESILKELKNFRETENVKAVVLRIDSPGGAVGPSQEIYREIRKTIGVKPVIASMGAIAASGGYYVAAAADGIMANPGTITGSIGVIMEFTNFKDLLDKIGLYPVVIKSGEFKDIGSPVRKLTKAEETLLQDFVDTVHMQFVRDVAEGRRMKADAVKKIADGRILSGERALTLGLIDRIGNFSDAVEWAGRRGGIKGRIITVYPPEKKYPLIRKMLEMSSAEIESLIQRVNMNRLTGGYLYNPAGGR